MNKISIPLIEVKQPIGSFYMSVIEANILEKIIDVKRREDGIGYQRQLNKAKVKEITDYCDNPDATFPAPIILSINEDSIYQISNNQLHFKTDSFFSEIIDGQHRAFGIFNSKNKSNFQLPLIIMFDLTDDEKAYIFSTINSKQTKVSMSLIYDLFSISKTRSPQKTCHELTRLLNNDEKSPFYQRLKMLGRKEYEKASLSQGSFIRYLLPLLSKKPDEDLRIIKLNPDIEPERFEDILVNDNNLLFRKYFLSNKDEIIYKVLLNVFNAVRDVFEREWDNPDEYILSKTLGYGAILSALPKLLEEGQKRKTLTKDFFYEIFTNLSKYLQEKKLELTSKDFPSNEHQQKRLADLILKANNL